MSIEQEKMKKWFSIKQNPNLAVLDFLENADKFTKNLAKKAIEEITQQLIDEFNEKISEMIKQLEKEIPEISEQLKEQIKEYVLFHPELFKGEDGKNYILTEKDKKQITDSIKVPVVKQIVEKREIIREKPISIITNEIKEVAKYEEPEQIAKKLNSLEEVIEQKVIKGLKEKFEEFKNAIKNIQRAKGGGGGMGNVQHESFSVSSVTTTISVSQKISGMGYAIWAYYNGQNIVRGTHFSVGNDLKTLTLTFVKNDNTIIDIIYIR